MAELLGFAPAGSPLAAVEFALWLEFYRSHGFEVDRQEWASANAGAAAARAMGARVTPSDLVPRFGAVRGSDPASIMAWFDSLAKRG